MSKLMDLQYGFFNRIRHRRATEVAGRPGTAPDFEALRGRKHALVVTFKRSGEAVPTPVWFGLDDAEKLYFRSEPHVAKIRRIQNDAHVRVGPCNMRGKPLGPLAEGRARVLPPSENERAEAVIASNYGVERRVYEGTAGRIGIDVVYVEVEPAP